MRCVPRVILSFSCTRVLIETICSIERNEGMLSRFLPQSCNQLTSFPRWSRQLPPQSLGTSSALSFTRVRNSSYMWSRFAHPHYRRLYQPGRPGRGNRTLIFSRHTRNQTSRISLIRDRCTLEESQVLVVALSCIRPEAISMSYVLQRFFGMLLGSFWLSMCTRCRLL